MTLFRNTAMRKSLFTTVLGSAFMPSALTGGPGRDCAMRRGMRDAWRGTGRRY
jgi:hypothetical protein